MESLFTNLGINWRLLVAQGVNFFVLVFLLTYLFYKPFIKLLKDRRHKIEAGIENARLADKRLQEAESLKQAEIVKGEKAALVIIEEANKFGQAHKEKIRKEGEIEAELMKKKTEELGRRLIQREMENLERNSREIVEKAIFAAVGLNPKEIDGKLANDAMSALKKLKV